MNWRKRVYLPYAWLRGYRFPTLLSSYLRQYERGLSGQTVTPALALLLVTRSRHTVMPYGPGLCLGGLVTLFLR